MGLRWHGKEYLVEVWGVRKWLEGKETRDRTVRGHISKCGTDHVNSDVLSCMRDLSSMMSIYFAMCGI